MNEEIPELRVHIHHVRTPDVCAMGIKRWFERNGIDFTDFLQNGMPISEAEKLDDEMARRACAAARKEAVSDGK